MSRLIVKNLPSGIKEERLRNHFGTVGSVTDCSLKYTKSGVFRKFAFIGYKTGLEATTALQQFNKTFIDASKIAVEIAKDFGDTNKPRAWSKYAKEKESTAKQTHDNVEKQKPKHSNKVKEDPKFSEFVNVHQNVQVKPVWTNDGARLPGEEHENDEEQVSVPRTAEDIRGLQQHTTRANSSDEEMDVEQNRSAVNKGLSDLDYLKSKISGRDKKQTSKSTPDPPDTVQTEVTERQVDKCKSYMLKLKGLPTRCGENAVKEFFHPLKLAKLHVAKNAVKRPIGIAYVGFSTESDLEQALRRNKNFIGGKRIFLKACDKEQLEISQPDKPRPWELKDDGEECEGIAETGRLFVRNLSYSCTEEDLEAEFKQFGPLTEVKCPVDSLTKKVKGFAFVTYMIPENAVKAYSELDGKVFQGRMLHVLPAKEEKESIEESTEASSFKKKNSAKQKAKASNSYNWNSLFLGANAVADVLAETYDISKSDILDTELKGSLGVRLALGETQVVQETRMFLSEHGVALDSFSQANAARSKTVILVKNLPAKTAVEELELVFSPFGSLGRVLLPPSGITAIVEFIVPIEAKAAFTKLAYRKFRHVPLYLEWAPMEVFTSPPTEKVQVMEGEAVEDKKSQKEDSADTRDKLREDDDDDSEEETIGSVLFVKNLNFATTDENLKQHFADCKAFKKASVAKKKNMKNVGEMLSMGYGFIEFTSESGALEIVKHMQHTELDGHSLELKVSNRTTSSNQADKSVRKKQTKKKQRSSKILVRNIPFEAKQQEVVQLFKVFGELKSVRLPKKMGGTGSHRGFGFVDFLTKPDAKRAFDSLCHSTHLYGRRLVLEWADDAEDLEDIRKRTAEHFHTDSEYGSKKKFTKSGLTESLEMSLQ